ncbi:PepSY domain-containing protein [Reichenbachiella sp. 5M10]|uniref:PepSY domain-containing protein n=1 Tax=Reichenbachiella sp. 5M10 TaxID=1889772 RepID=UPI00210154CB|nr:PepSY domain-containing protein [Reichenbachiella sp. 5M10]
MKMRIYHRYLGFFLAGIMAVYALSGIVLVFRDTDAFHKVNTIEKVLPKDTEIEELGKELGIKRFRIDRIESGIAYFKDGTYDIESGKAVYTKKELPYLLDKMTHMHKATSSRPLAFLNIFFGVSLFFFVMSSFWMFVPGTSVFRKGLYFALAGLGLTLLVLFV